MPANGTETSRDPSVTLVLPAIQLAQSTGRRPNGSTAV
jgi:hypothetical protein